MNSRTRIKLSRWRMWHAKDWLTHDFHVFFWYALRTIKRRSKQLRFFEESSEAQRAQKVLASPYSVAQIQSNTCILHLQCRVIVNRDRSEQVDGRYLSVVHTFTGTQYENCIKFSTINWNQHKSSMSDQGTPQTCRSSSLQFPFLFRSHL